jgi:N-acetylgalactosamine kinase
MSKKAPKQRRKLPDRVCGRDIIDAVSICSDSAMRDIQALLKHIAGTERQDADIARIGRVVRLFAKEFPGDRQIFVVRAPGRVNLIGEHTDYNGLAVLPIAIDRDILLVGSPRGDSFIRASNSNASFAPRRFESSDSIPEYPAGDWGNYAKAAAQSLSRHFAGRRLCGFDAMVDGNIPIASGLSSSSALVVAFALAICAANGLDVDRLQLAELLAHGEHYVGTRGGGMDQAVCLLARPGHALKTDFFPLRVEHTPLPRGYRFVVCNSLVAAPKSAAAQSAYNLRASETRIAATVLGRALNKMGRRPDGFKRLGDLYSESLNMGDKDIGALIEETFVEESYSLDETARMLGAKPDDVSQQYFGAFDKAEIASITGLKLRSRTRHVIAEGRRVDRAAEALRNERAEEFGRLMNESHQSCANDYEISTPELDALVSIARDAGALGARLTGAGFGGCTINLVAEDAVERFVEIVEKKYYGEYIAKQRPDLTGLTSQPDRIFICNSVEGAGEVPL